MAAVQEQVKPGPAARYDTFIDTQLGRARGRIRSLDISLAVLGLICGTLAYALVVALLDRWFELTPLARQLAFAGFAVAALAYLAGTLVWPLLRSINPYYAAREVERTLPGAKNSVVNWLDLRDESLPPAIRSALVQRAAKDLSKADLEQAISGRRVNWLGGITFALAVATVIALILLRPQRFVRALAPFLEVSRPARTLLTLVKPAGGDVTVSVGDPIHFVVDVDGRVPDVNKPDALKLLYRYRQGDPYEEQPLELKDLSTGREEWGTTLRPERVKNGFWYKVAGGDAETPEYRVNVRSTPHVNSLDVTYHYPRYLRLPDKTLRKHNGDLQALRGTHVFLTAHTNRQVKDGWIEVEFAAGRERIGGELITDDPEAVRFHVVLKQDGRYRIFFASADGERNADPPVHQIQVERDGPPVVTITKPAPDSLQANAVLSLEGRAEDDIGVKDMTLRLKLRDKNLKEIGTLQPKRYRPEKNFRLDNGALPLRLEYRDHLELDKVRDSDGTPVSLQAGIVLEYWLEATDECEIPAANVGESKHYQVLITPPDSDKEQLKQERQRNMEEQRNHEANQDKKMEEENQAIQNQQKQQKSDEEKQSGKDEQPKNQGDEKGSPKDKGSQPDSEQAKKDQETERQLQQLQDKLDKRKQQEGKQGDGSDKKDGPPDKKDGPPDKKDGPPDKKDGPPASTDKKDGPPDKKDGPPTGTDKKNGPPDKKDGPPTSTDKKDGPPDKKDGPPDKKDGPPTGTDKKDGPPTGTDKKDGPPDKKDGPPTGTDKKDGPPDKKDGPPTGTDKKDGPPDKKDGPPTGTDKKDGPPDKKDGPPDKKDDPPTGTDKKDGPLDKKDGPPASTDKKDGPPDKKDGPPDKKDGPPTGTDKKDGPPDKKDGPPTGTDKKDGPPTGTDKKDGPPDKKDGPPDKKDGPPTGTDKKDGPPDKKDGPPTGTDKKDGPPDKKDGPPTGTDKKDSTDGKSNKELLDQLKKELNNLAKDLQSDDPKKREEAAKKLGQLIKQAQEMGKQQGPQGPKETLTEQQKKELGQLAQKLDQARRDAEKQGLQVPGSGDGRDGKEALAQPDPLAGTPNPDHQKRPLDLRLFDKFTAKELEAAARDAGITPEQLEALKKAAKELAERRRAEAEGPELLAPPKRAGTLINQGPRLADAPTGAKDTEVKHGGAGLPPAQFRDAYRSFTSKIAAGTQPPEKKE
jgi:hypothetical protein